MGFVWQAITASGLAVLLPTVVAAIGVAQSASTSRHHYSIESTRSIKPSPHPLNRPTCRLLHRLPLHHPSLEAPTTEPNPSVPSGEDLNITFDIKQVEVEGNTIFQREIAALVKEYQGEKGKNATFETLLELRAVDYEAVYRQWVSDLWCLLAQ